MKTTLNKIKEHLPCEDGWKKLLIFLNKTEADDEELSLLTVNAIKVSRDYANGLATKEELAAARLDALAALAAAWDARANAPSCC
jgi:hypothetical protein